MTDLTHLDAQGNAHMVDVGAKPVTVRRAVARGHLRVSPATILALREGRTPKGDVLAAARIAGIMAAKRTPELLPLCHPILLNHVSVTVEIDDDGSRLDVTAEARTAGPTGVEMEALTAVSVAALTLYDMLKGIDRSLLIGGIELVEKMGGTRHNDGTLRPVKVVPKSPPPPAFAPNTSRGPRALGVELEGLMDPEPSPLDALPIDTDDSFVGLSGLALSGPGRKQGDAHRRGAGHHGAGHHGAPGGEGFGGHHETPSGNAIHVVRAHPLGAEGLPAQSEAVALHPHGLHEVAPSMPPVPPELRLAAEPPRILTASRGPQPVVSVPPTPSPSAMARTDRAVRLAPDDPRLPRFLGRDRIDSAYMLGDLDQPYAEHCVWYGAVDEGALTAVVLLYSGLSVPTLLTAGDPIDVEAVLAAYRDQLPRRMHGHIRNAHRHGVEAWYDLGSVRDMVRMGLSKAQYVPIGTGEGAEMLGHRDTGHLMALYQHYPDNFFDPAQLDSGLYYGVRDGGELLSVAGVHVVSDRHDVAAIGNIVTHADHRGRGLASHCVRTILDRLFSRVGHVALNVQGDNPSALALYRKFGFTERFGFLEATLTLR